MSILVPIGGKFVAAARDDEELDILESEIFGYSITKDDADDSDNNSDEAVEDADANADDDQRGRVASCGVWSLCSVRNGKVYLKRD